MKCPRCVQRVHSRARECPHCAFSITDIDRVFGQDDVRLRALTDAAGVLRRKERIALRGRLDQFQQNFPQLFFGIYFGSFRETPSLRQFGFWLLNRGAFEDVDVSRPNEGGILLSVDVGGKSAGITSGYALGPFLSEDATFGALSGAHPYFLEGQWLRAIESVLSRVTKVLAKQSRRAEREANELRSHRENTGSSDGGLRGLRERHKGVRKKSEA